MAMRSGHNLPIGASHFADPTNFDSLEIIRGACKSVRQIRLLGPSTPTVGTRNTKADLVQCCSRIARANSSRENAGGDARNSSTGVQVDLYLLSR